MIGENGIANPIWFVGIVEDNSDIANGRVRVRAFGFHPPVADNLVQTQDLPWAHVVRNSRFTSMPDRGDLVMGMFADGRDAQMPLVMGVINSAKFSLPALGVNPAALAGGIPYSPSSPSSAAGGAINTQLDPHARAFLDATASQESGGAYDVLNGGGTIPLTGGHPNVMGGLGTTAAGRYQFTYGTWNDISGNATFSPENQDYYAWQLAQQRYAAYGYGDLDAELRQNGLTPQVLQALSPTWEAFSNQNNYGTIISTYDQSLATVNGGMANGDMINPFLAPSQDVSRNIGNNPMPPQFNNENIEATPALVQSAARRSVEAGPHLIDEPGVPMAGDGSSSVWNASWNGSFIELGGRNQTDEYINITHASGSRVTIDSNGNVVIKAFGRLHSSSEGVIEEFSAGPKIAVHQGGYAVYVTGGAMEIISNGDMTFQAGGNLTFAAGGKITLNGGDSVDIAGSAVRATARVDAIDFLSAGKLSIQSSGGDVGIAGATVAISSDGQLSLGGSGPVAVAGSEIHLNSTIAPSAALTAVAADVPEPITRGVSAPTTPMASPPPISADMADDSVSV